MSKRRKRLSVGLAVLIMISITSTADAFYSLVGVIDCSGKTIVPCEYHRIESLRNGFFYLEELDKENPVRQSYSGRIVDSDGKLIDVKLPTGSTLSDAYLPKSFGEKENSKTLPDGTILQIHGKGGFGLCRSDGSVILEPSYQSIGIPSDGLFPVYGDYGIFRGKPLFHIDSKTGRRVSASKTVVARELKPLPSALQPKSDLNVVYKREQNSPTSCDLVDRHGTVLLHFEDASLCVVAADRIIKYLRVDHFNSAAWKSPNSPGEPGLYRVGHFASFLKDFDLIGMQRSELERLLGQSERPGTTANFYWLGYGFCGNSWTAMEIEFTKDKVKQWREVWRGGGEDYELSFLRFQG